MMRLCPGNGAVRVSQGVTLCTHSSSAGLRACLGTSSSDMRKCRRSQASSVDSLANLTGSPQAPVAHAAKTQQQAGAWHYNPQAELR